jgi:hypothetical protein
MVQVHSSSGVLAYAAEVAYITAEGQSFVCIHRIFRWIRSIWDLRVS